MSDNLTKQRSTATKEKRLAESIPKIKQIREKEMKENPKGETIK